MAQPSESDVYLSYNNADRKVVEELEQQLISSGLTVWRDETSIAVGTEWERASAAALAGARSVLICVGPSGLGRGQLREVDAAAARSAVDPDLPFAAALLPGVPGDFPASALPVQLAERQWLDLRRDFTAVSSFLSSLALTQQPVPTQKAVEPRDDPPVTPSVQSAAAQLTGEVTAAAFVMALLSLHPEYGERRGEKVDLELRSPERATAASWLARVRALLNRDAVKELHGRLVIVSLARLDDTLREQLELGGFLASVEREIREPLADLFAAAPTRPEETVPTHTDNPATIDELNREGFARIVARRIRDTRASELAAADAIVDAEFPFGRSFLVHVHGPWGIGKTSLLNFLRNALHERDPEPWVVVTFNAWQHQRSHRHGGG